MASELFLVLASVLACSTVTLAGPVDRNDTDIRNLVYQRDYKGWGEQKPVDNGWNGWGEKKPFDNGWSGWQDTKPLDNGWNGWQDKKPLDNGWNGWEDKKPLDNEWNSWGEKKPLDNGWNGWEDKKPLDNGWNGWGEKKPLDNGWNGWGEKKPLDNGWNGWGEKKPLDNGWNGWGEKKPLDNGWNGWGEKKPLDNGWNGWGEKKPLDNGWNGWGEKKPLDNGWNGWGEKKPLDNGWNGWGEKKPLDNGWNGWGEKKPLDNGWNGWGEKRPLDNGWNGWGEKKPLDNGWNGWGEKKPLDNGWNGWGEKENIPSFDSLWNGWGDKNLLNTYGQTEYEKESQVTVFLQILKFLSESREEDTSPFFELFKYFTKVAWKKESFNGYSQQQVSKFSLAQYNRVDYNPERDFLSLCDGDDLDTESRYKKLFLLYLRFRSHYQEQKKIVLLKETKAEVKVRQQYSLFSDLVVFAKFVQSEKTVLTRFVPVLETTFRQPYNLFKQCAAYGSCNKWNGLELGNNLGFDFEPKSVGGYEDYERDGRHFELFLKLHRFPKLFSELDDGRDDYDDEDDTDDYYNVFQNLGWNYDRDDEDDDDDLKDKHPVYVYLANLRKHLGDHKPVEFKQFFEDKDEVEAKNKMSFFALKGFKLFQEQKALWDKRNQLQKIFVLFSKYLQYQEDLERCRQEFLKFKEWRQARENQLKLQTFLDYLSTVSLVRGYKRFSVFGSKAGYGRDYDRSSSRVHYVGYQDVRRYDRNYPGPSTMLNPFFGKPNYQRDDFFKKSNSESRYYKERYNRY
ncbi:hypothetical protein Btru_070204 [Bulinus truncatus]|nr:hypothetical protein Btru_070204 [Bulinus truncatus]